MARKKKQGILGKLFNGIAWLVSSVLRGLFNLAKWLVLSFYSLLAGAGKKAGEARKQAARPAVQPEFASLNQLNSKNGSLEEFEQKVYSPKSTIGLVLGARGSGKSALGMRFLENISAKKTRKVYAMGFNPSALPKWVYCTNELDAIPNGAFVLVDEGGIAFSSRSAMSNANKLLSSLILVARHKDISVLFISQNSSNLEINAIRQADYLLLRKPSLLQMDFERKKISDIYKKIAPDFEKLPQKGKHATFVYSDEFEGFAANQLPSFWSQKASKSFSGYVAKQG